MDHSRVMDYQYRIIHRIQMALTPIMPILNTVLNMNLIGSYLLIIMHIKIDMHKHYNECNINNYQVITMVAMRNNLCKSKLILIGMFRPCIHAYIHPSHQINPIVIIQVVVPIIHLVTYNILLHKHRIPPIKHCNELLRLGRIMIQHHLQLTRKVKAKRAQVAKVMMQRKTLLFI